MRSLSPAQRRETASEWVARMEAKRGPRRQPATIDPSILALMERRLTPDRVSQAVSAIYARTAYGHDEAAASDFQANAGY